MNCDGCGELADTWDCDCGGGHLLCEGCLGMERKEANNESASA